MRVFKEYNVGVLLGFCLPIFKPLSLVFQDFSAGVVARKRESQLTLGWAYSKNHFSIDAPSLSCNIEKLLWFWESCPGWIWAGGSGLSRAGLAAVTEMDNLKTRLAAGGGKKFFFLSVKNCPERNVAKSRGKTVPGD